MKLKKGKGIKKNRDYGKLIFKGEYKYGKKYKGKEYYRGKLKFEREYKDGKYYKGKIKKYNDNGKLMIEGENKDGSLTLFQNQKNFTKIIRFGKLW